MTVTLKIKYHDFVLITRSKTLDVHRDETDHIFSVVEYLLRYPELPSRPVRLLGVSLSNLDHTADEYPRQLLLPLEPATSALVTLREHGQNLTT